MKAGFLLTLAWRSAWNRRVTLMLTVCSIALSTVMLLGVERLRTDVRQTFSAAVSGTDLIVGARTGSVQLLLYAVFRVGAATNNIRWTSIEALETLRSVAWVVPLSLGDSHRGYPVLGTTAGYFDHFRHGRQQALQFREGVRFVALHDAVIGAEVADRLGYRIGESIVLAHGTGAVPLRDHGDQPFVVTGILTRTGTPVDRTVHISLEAMEALHAGWIGGLPRRDRRGAADSNAADANAAGVNATGADAAPAADLRPKSVTAALVGLQHRSAVFSVQRRINTYPGEPLMAILPGVALDELWTTVGVGETALLAMSGLVAGVSVAGLMSVMLAGLGERRRELAVLRATGASPAHLLLLLGLEGLIVTLAGIVTGLLALGLLVLGLGPVLQTAFGLSLHLTRPTSLQGLLLAALLATGCLASLLPGWRAYRLSLGDGLSPRL